MLQVMIYQIHALQVFVKNYADARLLQREKPFRE